MQQGRHYLVVQYEDGNIFHLALHRFLNATATTFAFERPKFNLKHYLAEQHFGFGNGKKNPSTFSALVKPYGFHLTETPLSTDQEITDRRRYLFSSCNSGGKWDAELVDYPKFGKDWGN